MRCAWPTVPVVAAGEVDAAEVEEADDGKAMDSEAVKAPTRASVAVAKPHMEMSPPRSVSSVPIRVVGLSSARKSYAADATG